MKITKRTTALLAVLLFIMTVLFSACGGSGDGGYRVTVKDALGQPYTSGVVVRFLQDGTQVAMQPVDENGVASKDLEPGDYAVELSFTDSEAVYHYDTDLQLSKKNPAIDVIMAKTLVGEPQILYVGSDEFDAYAVSTGCTYAQLDGTKRNYFLFTPTMAGTYEFSLIDGGNAAIGYYGAPHFVQEFNNAEVVDGKFRISINADMIGTGDGGTSVYVLGVDANGAQSAVIGIERVGDPQKTISDEPWTIYETTATLVKYQLPAGAKLAEFDLEAATDTYKPVFNENDGFYHLNNENGPLILVRLAEDCDYIACFKTMLDRSGVSKYFFDENGEFVKKESYSESLLEYLDYVDDAEGVYPLTKDLEYIIKQRGDYAGWWNIESNGYIFKDVNGNNISEINAELVWLLMCCYIEG